MKYIILLLALFAACAVAWIIFSNLEDIKTLLDLSFLHISLATFFYVLNFIIAAIPIWLIILGYRKHTLFFYDWIKILFISRMTNYILPKSGAIYKAYTLKSKHGLSYTEFVHTHAFFTWIAVVFNFAFVSLMILFFMPDLRLGEYHAILVTSIFFLIFLFFPFLIHYSFGKFNFENAFFIKLHKKIHGIFTAMLIYGRNYRFMLLLFSLILLKFLFYILMFKFLFSAMGLEVGYAQMGLFIAVQQVSTLVMITPGNIGIRELVYGAVGEAIGIGVAQGIMASAILRAVQYLVVIPCGLAFGGWQLFFAGKSHTHQS